MKQELRQIAEAYGLPFAEAVTAEMLDASLLARIPVTWAREQGILPVRLDGEACLLSSSPDCLAVLQQAQLAAGLELRPVLAAPDVIAAAIDQAFSEGVPQPSAAPEAEAAASLPLTTREIAAQGDDLLAGAEAAPVTQTLNAILLEAVRKRASDIHFEPCAVGMRIRYRIDGGLYEQPAPPRKYAEAIVSRAKVMARMDIAEKRLPQDGMAQVRVGDRAIDVRVSTIPVTDGERVVMRLLDRDNAWIPLEALGMPPSVRPAFEELLVLPNGLLLVSGPTGSGKTTTLYSALGSLDATRRNILTVEDPVEYRIPAIGQIQVKPKIGLNFAAGLRHILRQDPDVILVGETRDAETAEIAVRAALTGHLVFTTLHTNDAPSSVARLVDMGIEPYLLAACLRGILAQRLVRKLCQTCHRIVDCPTEPRESALYESLRTDLAGKPRWEAVGCPACLEGYKGRIGLFELMPCPEAVADTIHAHSGDVGRLRSLAATLPGYHSLRSDALAKLQAGETDLREILTALSV